MANSSDTDAAPLMGIACARELYCDGLAEIQFMGVTARYIPFAYCRDESGLLVRRVGFTIRAPIGAMTEANALMRKFMTKHLLVR